MIKLKKGLDLPIEGAPQQKIYPGPNVSKVALIGDDVAGMKPSMVVQVGDKVKTGDLLFTDKKTEGVRYTSPATGEIIAINRGAKRAFESVVLRVEEDAFTSFDSYKGSEASSYDKEAAKSLLLESGMWPSIRRRPFSKVANPSETPSSIFVTAIDTHPLSANPVLVIKENEQKFKRGLELIGKLSDTVHLCTAEDFDLEITSAKKTVFSGPHPAGLVGTHIHFLDPVGEKKHVWHIGYQDVIAIGGLLESGQLFTDRYISVAGPIAKKPRIIKTRVGACLTELMQNEVFEDKKPRIVSGSVFGGRKAQDTLCYLGRFHNQVSLLEENNDREFLGWHSPGPNRFSIKPIYISRFIKDKFAFTTNGNGSLRSIVPIGSYEAVMPLDILPTFLLKSLMSGNTDKAVQLGALELDEEDLSLCTFVDPCKNEFASKLRESLITIEKEG